jgi:hypothetical protein
VQDAVVHRKPGHQQHCYHLAVKWIN